MGTALKQNKDIEAKMKEKSLNTILIVILIICASLFVLFNLHSFVLNATNHTGINMYLIIGTYILMAAITLSVYIRSRKKESKLKPIIYITIFLLCLLGVLNIFMFDKLNIMMNYETWLNKGMPGKVLTPVSEDSLTDY